MCSTPDRPAARRATSRRLYPIALLGAAVLLGGCAGPAPRPYTPPPMVIDPAIQKRDWERSVAYYPNGDTVSGHNRFPVRSDAQIGEAELGDAVYDIGASLAQTVALPFTYLFIPPFAPAVYTGENIGPSYTAMPPMRPADPTARVDGLVVDRDTLRVVEAPGAGDDGQDPRYVPKGPNDTRFVPVDPAPAREWE